jgi:hypothetical protein
MAARENWLIHAFSGLAQVGLCRKSLSLSCMFVWQEHMSCETWQTDLYGTLVISKPQFYPSSSALPGHCMWWHALHINALTMTLQKTFFLSVRAT